jgi:hypothetical protein
LNTYSISILYLKHQFQRSSRVIFLQITPHSYFKLICCTPIDACGPQPWLMHVMPACWLCRASLLARRPIWLKQRKILKNDARGGVRASVTFFILLLISVFLYSSLNSKFSFELQTQAECANKNLRMRCRVYFLFLFIYYLIYLNKCFKYIMCTHTKTIYLRKHSFEHIFYIYTILKASISTVVPRHLFTNNPSQLF